jgi:hypothetical protein
MTDESENYFSLDKSENALDSHREQGEEVTQ